MDQAAPGAAPTRRAWTEYVAAALAVADTDGLAAVSMRRVAGDLGSGTATLYRYITNRDELVDLMVDAAHGEDPLPEPAGTGAPTSPRSPCAARDPAAALVVGGRTGGGPRSAPTRAAVRIRAARRGRAHVRHHFGLAALGAVHAYVLGSVAIQQAVRRAEQRTGLTEEQWQRSVGP